MMTNNNTVSIIHHTKNNVFIIDSYISSINNQKLLIDNARFENLCKVGCKNYNKKYSCPPLSSSFLKISKPYNYMVINLFKIDLAPYKKIYNTIRMTNVVNKSIQRKIFDKLIDHNKSQEKIILLENGSCRLCKTCNFQKDLPCKYPDKMRYSLEATGINVNELTQKCFGMPLQWYKKDNYPEYQCVVGGILTNNPSIIVKTLSTIIEQYPNI